MKRGGVHAGITGFPTGDGGGGVVCGAVFWECRRRSGGLDGVGGERSWVCFYRSRRVTTLEPRRTLAAVSGVAVRVNLDCVQGRFTQRQPER